MVDISTEIYTNTNKRGIANDVTASEPIVKGHQSSDITSKRPSSRLFEIVSWRSISDWPTVIRHQPRDTIPKAAGKYYWTAQPSFKYDKGGTAQIDRENLSSVDADVQPHFSHSQPYNLLTRLAYQSHLLSLQRRLARRIVKQHLYSLQGLQAENLIYYDREW